MANLHTHTQLTDLSIRMQTHSAFRYLMQFNAVTCTRS